ncbi:MAG: electron transport complex subunit RsxC [Firmicutes bacterium]|nr:electron transport complex subunit RsxC [Bacillota bacterium]
MRLRTFRGGIYPPAMKGTSQRPIVDLPAPAHVVIPMQQHVGTTCSPLVKVGDTVKIGQKIGQCTTFISAPIHASISGKVKSIGAVDVANGNKVLAITIENDFQNTLVEGIAPPPPLEELSPAEIAELVREAGIVGMGGAGFPTSVKLTPPADVKIDMIIINAVECEPYLTCDQMIIIEEVNYMISGIRAIMKALGLDHACIGIKINMEGAIDRLHEIILEEKGIDIVPLVPKYPQGEERQLIYAVTGKEVPSGALPQDIGIAVFNAATAWSIGHLLADGLPLTERVITVGGAVKEEGNYRIKVGTTVDQVIEMVGGYTDTPKSIIVGGPMTGFGLYHTNIPLTKQNNGVIVLTEEHVKEEEMTECIHCGQCVQVCPARIMPNRIAKLVKKADVDGLEKFNVLDCRDCAACAYVCPAKIPLLHYMKIGKNYVNEERAKNRA